ncbi:MAG: aldehyde dehydrogenase family protein, partial [Candidatus Nanopelagicales bacterium]|nr:aldehyde dehydrogenase family protein [Candidatus Nanopelagicales bacterium]
MTDPTRQLEIARAGQHDWGRLSPTARAEALRPLAAAIGKRLDDIADLIADENGKPRAEAIAHEVLAAVQLV